MASGEIPNNGTSHWWYCKAVRLIGNKRYQAAVLDELNGSYSNSPYSILIFGFRTLYLVSSTYRTNPLMYLDEILKGDVTFSLTDGVLKTGSDGNRQYVALIPNGVTLTEVT